MKKYKTRRVFSPTAEFCEVSNAEMHGVQGGIWGFAIAYGFAKLNDYLVKLATDPADSEIPIEPLT